MGAKVEFDWIAPSQWEEISRVGVLRSGVEIPQEWLEENSQAILEATKDVALEVLAAYLIEDAAIRRSWLEGL